MFPEFNENGYLPPGIHLATLTVIRKRYAYNQIRRRLFEGVEAMVFALRSAGCVDIYLDGSYITNKAEPADYDAVWEFKGVDNTVDPILRDGTLEQIKRKYFGDVFCRIPEIPALDYLECFQTDRFGVPKGVVKIELKDS
jgi:hypothetical protein